ncbi:MAG: hypothetical protein AAFO69_09820 [Bacteroidota bacterium]
MHPLRKWGLRIGSVLIISITTITITVLNPGFLYANMTQVGNYSVYHQNALNEAITERLQNVDRLVAGSELYEEGFEVKLCMDDGSFYPTLMKTLRGNAFGWGFLEIAVFKGDANFEENRISLHGYHWNLEQLMVHEITHCMQQNNLGLWNSNPMANHPDWKWEGYAEYVARQGDDQVNLMKNIGWLKAAKQDNPDAWGVFFDDGSVAPRSYYEYWLLVQFCLDVKKMTYQELLNSRITRDEVEQEMQEYFEKGLQSL